jgi:hypothetical protein
VGEMPVTTRAQWKKAQEEPYGREEEEEEEEEQEPDCHGAPDRAQHLNDVLRLEDRDYEMMSSCYRKCCFLELALLAIVVVWIVSWPIMPLEMIQHPSDEERFVEAPIFFRPSLFPYWVMLPLVSLWLMAVVPLVSVAVCWVKLAFRSF